MSDNENQEDGNSSNSKTPDIKNKNIQQQEQDINLQIGTSTSQEQTRDISLTNEALEGSPKRPRITESDEAESSKKNEQESDCESDDSTFNYIGQDPLLVVEEVILKYYDFIVYLQQILKNDEKKQDWSIDIIDRADTLVMNLGRRLRVVTIDMAGLEAVEGMENEYAFKRASIVNVLNVFLYINTRIASSNSLKLVSDIKNRRKVLPICLREFATRRQELNLLMDEMQILKEVATRIGWSR
ncbi:hypothetical protein Csa_020597 [Cucumis sativus]|uniref:Uncharacterized protein n=1 Tax=Cucumis sativus TaxID=3659 RepID=A0A0A0KBL9_CUCSA|nr:hypothetical protein Csa_020597 [Cucumis sativus]